MEEIKKETNSQTKYCKHCGEKIDIDAILCVKCGKQVEELKSSQPQVVINNSNNNVNNNTNTVQGGVSGKPKNKAVAIILCCLGFVFVAGLHKFYEGKIFMGIVYLLTGGFLFVGTIIDLIALLGKPNPYYV